MAIKECIGGDCEKWENVEGKQYEKEKMWRAEHIAFFTLHVLYFGSILEFYVYCMCLRLKDELSLQTVVKFTRVASEVNLN